MSKAVDFVKAPKAEVYDTMQEVLEPGFVCNGEHCPTSEYVDAIEDLAALSPNKVELEASDFAELKKRCNLKVLADLIQNDPYLPVILANKEALVKGKFSIDGDSKHGPVPAQYYKRLVYLSQIALKHMVDPDLDTNGVYGPKTTKAVAEFQQKVGIDDDGTRIGFETISALVMRCRISKEEMVARLIAVRDELEREGASVYVKNDQRKEASPLVEETLLVLTDSLKWIGELDIMTSANLPTGSNTVNDALNRANDTGKIDVLGDDRDGDGKPDKVKEISKVGPRVIDAIIERVKEFEI